MIATSEEMKKLFREESGESFICFAYMHEDECYNPEIPVLKTAQEYFELYFEYQKANFEDRANKALAFALKLEPRNPNILREYAKTGYKNKKWYYHNEKEIYDPKDAADLLIEIESDNPINYIIRANLNKYTYNSCIDDILTAIKLGLRDSKTYEMLGDFYAENKDFDMALQSYSYAIELSTDCSNLYLKKANIYFELKNDKEAYFNTNQSLYYNDKNTDAHYLKYELF